jgi:nucleotide-binding universal stress UspA family protein
MFKKVLWATDGSEAADRAIPVVRMLAAEGGGELLVVHCVELSRGSYPAHANEGTLRNKIERQVAELNKDGVPTRLGLPQASLGGAAHAIADTARDEGSDVIVVGTRGHTALAGLLLGSVTQRLLHIAPCPVLAVPAQDASSNSPAQDASSNS